MPRHLSVGTPAIRYSISSGEEPSLVFFGKEHSERMAIEIGYLRYFEPDPVPTQMQSGWSPHCLLAMDVH
jgi:hypothetical protein